MNKYAISKFIQFTQGANFLKFTRCNITLKNVTKLNFLSRPQIYRNFSTGNNQISEKESLELIEAGVFEVLKSAAKCKHDKLSRTATFEELGNNYSLNLRI